MTLIECFDVSHIRNVAGCLRLKPHKLIFLGDEKKMQSPVERYRKILKEREQDTVIELCHVDLDDIANITHTLSRLVRSESSCIIDITGGAEQLLIAVGAVLADLDEQHKRHVSVQKFDLFSGQAQDWDGDHKVLSGQFSSLSVRELIALYSGGVYPHGEQPGEGYTPAELQLLWELVCQAPKNWNKQISILNELESRSESDEEIYLLIKYLENSIPDFSKKEGLVRELLENLHHCGVIDNRSSADVLCYRYLDPMLRRCVEKAGNVLEIKTLLEARALRINGEPYFSDCQMGVTIDWDGVVHEPSQRIPDTRNEIDVLVMRGMIPLFISCKNGNIGEEELYKLHTVAMRFGGACARKMLIATNLERRNTASGSSFIQRARDMNIYLVTDAAELTSADWRRVLQEAMEGMLHELAN